MTPLHQRALSAVLGLLLLAPPLAQAQSAGEVFGAITALTDWFNKLNVQFDSAVKTEGRAQLLRAVDRLRKELYTLEGDARILLDDLPDKPPTSAQRSRLTPVAQELQATVQRLSRTAREIGADLRLNEAQEVEAALSSGLRTRALVLQEVRRALLPENESEWNGPQLRARMAQGIEAVRAAQLAVTSFSKKLAAAT